MIKTYLYLIVGAIFLLFLLFFTKQINYFQAESASAGVILNLINTSLAYFFFKKSLKKRNKQFMVLVFGGMAARLMLVLAMFTIIIVSLKIDIYAYIFTFLILYFVSLVWEIGIYLKESKKIRS